MLLLLSLTGCIYVTHLIRKHNITYHSLSFHFPSRLSITDLRYHRHDSIVFSAGIVDFSWSWTSLLRGKPRINSVYLEGAILKMVSGNEAPAAIKIPHFTVNHITLRNIDFEKIGQKDSLRFSVSNLRISSIQSTDKLSIDSVFMGSAHVIYLPGNQASEDSDSMDFAFQSIPPLEINYFNMENSGVQIRDPQHPHKISHLSCAFSGLKHNNLMNVSVHRLAFTYQDTLDMHIVLENGHANEQFHADLNGLAFRIPGIRLFFSHVHLEAKDGITAEIHLEQSALAFARITQFYPGIRSVLKAGGINPILHVKGEFLVHSSAAEFRSVTLGFYDSTRLALSGSINWAQSQPAIDISINPFATSRGDLNDLLTEKAYNRFFQWPTGILGQIRISGNVDSMDIQGHVKTDQGEIQAKSHIRTRQHNAFFSLDLTSDSIQLGNVETILPVNITRGHIHFYLEGLISENRDDYTNIEIQSHSLLYKGNDFNDLEFSYFSDAEADTIAVRMNDELLALDFSLFMPAEAHAASQFSGRVERLVPRAIHESLPEGTISMAFSGKLEENETRTLAEVALSSVRLITEGRSHLFPDSELELYTTHKDIRFTVQSEKREVLRLFTGKEFPAFKMPLHEWLASWPETEAKVDVKIGRDLLKGITGKDACMDGAQLTISKDDKNWQSALHIDRLRLDSLVAESLTLNLLGEEDELSGSLTIDAFRNSGYLLNHFALHLGYARNQYRLKLEGSLSDPAGKNEITLVADDLENGYQLRFAENSPLRLNDISWQILDNRGLVFNDSLHIMSGRLSLKNNHTRIRAATDGEAIALEIDSLVLDPLFALLTGNSRFHGELNAAGTYQTHTGNLAFSGKLHTLLQADTRLGEIRFSGNRSGKALYSSLQYELGHAGATVILEKTENTISYLADLKNIEIDLLTSFPFWPADLDMSGSISGNAAGTWQPNLTAKGMLIAENIDVTVPAIYSRIRLDRDTLFFNENELQFNDFRVQDEGRNDLLLNGQVRFSPKPTLDLAIKSRSFQLLNTRSPDAILEGKMNVATDLTISGTTDNLNVSGSFKTLPDAWIRYKMKKSFHLVDASQIVTFTDFEADRGILAENRENPSWINWNVNLEVAYTRLEILLNETTQEFVNLTGQGALNLRKGLDHNPLIYGSFHSESGNAFVKAPAIPDLELTIEEATVRWNGLPEEPVISFKGYKPVMANPRGLSTAFKDRKSPEPFKVYALLDQVSLTRFDLEFDLEGGATDTKAYLTSLPKDSRQAYALNLLVFGKFGTEEVSGNSYAVDQITSKLNEIARRNIKNVDLSFSANSYKVGSIKGSGHERTDFNYALTKAFLNNRLKYTIGGSVGLTLDDMSETPRSNILGNMEIRYTLTDTPAVVLKATRKEVYRGIIDGDVTEISVGVEIQKSYPRFRDFMKPKKQKRRE